MRVVAGLRPMLIIVWEWHNGLAQLWGCLGALEYPTKISCVMIIKVDYYYYLIVWVDLKKTAYEF